MKLVRTVGLISRPDLKPALEISRKIYNSLRQKGITVYPETKLASILGVKSLELKDMDVDIVIVVGGDGTILRTNMGLPKPIPILGINVGFRGFLASVSPEDALKSIDKLVHGQYGLDERALLSTEVNGIPQPDALNEVLIGSKTRSKIIHFEIWKDDRKVLRYSADGVIIATPTGSTAYSLSAGGPVLDPDIDGSNIIPLCPIPPVPSIVVPSACKIQVKLLRLGEAVLVIDGCYMRDLNPGDVVTLSRSSKKAIFVRIRERDFYDEFRKRILFLKEIGMKNRDYL